ncbi:MAG TPA: hypothetical protein ENI51_10890 [Candidatus Atribacteria bacterium]|nr:hypothetical protein [Candidatus Atribacteria bacterium]
MAKSYLIYIINAVLAGIFIYLQMGPQKLWKKIISTHGDISWSWFFVNMILLILICAFIVTSISIYIKSSSEEMKIDEEQIKKPSFQFQLSDNLYSDEEINKPGEIVYDGLITLPITETIFVNDLFLEIDFPVIIEKFELVNEIGVENPKVQLGIENIIELKESKGFECHTNSLNIEIEKLKPGAFFRFKVYSIYLPNRDINREVHYNGYFCWDTDGETRKEDIKDKFSPQFYKIAEFNLEKWKMLSQAISSIDPKQGTLEFWTSDQRWYEENNFFIEFIPLFETENFKIHMYRDRDNIFKCELTTYYHKDVLLQFKDLESLRSKPSHPRHYIVLTWSEENTNLYIDGELVDTYPE